MVIGNPDSWDQTTSFSGKDDYNDCTWSPCGRFVAAQTKAVVEIRNQLTFQLFAVLQPPKETSLLKGPLAYSPDGRSLACGFSGGILIWDVQTGGVAQSIDCIGDLFRLVWSLDGKTIGTAPMGSASSVTYGVASGVQLFAEKFEKEWIYHFWACEKSFRFLSMPYFSGCDYKLSISEIGPTRITIEPLQVATVPPLTVVFSPSTYRISISDPDTLRILDAQNSQSLLQVNNTQSLPSFSFDASLYAAPHNNGFRVWRYTAGGYVLLGEYLLPHIPSFSLDKLHLEFSPASTSVLSRYGIVLQVWRLHGPPTTPKTYRQHSAISRSGRYVATVHGSQSTVATINLHSQSSPQFIDTGGEIEGLAITGNVLLVAFSTEVVGWLLTEEGRVDGVVNNRRASHNDSIWTVTSRPNSLCFRVLGQAGVIGADSIFPFVYHIGTGGILDRIHRLEEFNFPWVSFYKQSDYQEHHLLRHLDTPQSDVLPENSWLASRTATGKAGWVVDPDGKHRFWVPVEWRAPWDPKNCHDDISTLFTRIGDQPVIIKF